MLFIFFWQRVLQETWEDHPDYVLLKEAEEVVKTKLNFINTTISNRTEICNIAKELKIVSLIMKNHFLFKIRVKKCFF